MHKKVSFNSLYYYGRLGMSFQSLCALKIPYTVVMVTFSVFSVSSCVRVLQDDDGETSRSSSVCKPLSLTMVDSSSVIVINASSKVTAM